MESGFNGFNEFNEFNEFNGTSKMKISNGERPVAPLKAPRKTGEHLVIETGLTKRELFSAIALHGLVSHYNEVDALTEEMATHAVLFADSLLAALDKPIN